MHRLLTKLFGWKYAYVKNSAHDGIYRIHTTNSGRRYVQPYIGTIVFLEEEGLYSKHDGWFITEIK